LISSGFAHVLNCRASLKWSTLSSAYSSKPLINKQNRCLGIFVVFINHRIAAASSGGRRPGSKDGSSHSPSSLPETPRRLSQGMHSAFRREVIDTILRDTSVDCRPSSRRRISRSTASSLRPKTGAPPLSVGHYQGISSMLICLIQACRLYEEDAIIVAKKGHEPLRDLTPSFSSSGSIRVFCQVSSSSAESLCVWPVPRLSFSVSLSSSGCRQKIRHETYP
jgi:hypothetical protein